MAGSNGGNGVGDPSGDRAHFSGLSTTGTSGSSLASITKAMPQPASELPSLVPPLPAGSGFGRKHVRALHVLASTAPIPCFAEGTHILTDGGERVVEELAVGDRVITYSGDARPIKWIGHVPKIHCERYRQPSKVRPVRIAAGAFGATLPHRDLWLSPDHSILFDDVMIPVKLLENGSSIRQMKVKTVTYHHVELEDHDVLRAEGLPVESYLETGSRWSFANGGGPVALYPDFSWQKWEVEGCRPLVVTGPKLEAARQIVRDKTGMRYSAPSRATAQ